MGAMTVRICSVFYVSTNQNATFSFGHDNREYATEKKTARRLGSICWEDWGNLLSNKLHFHSQIRPLIQCRYSCI